ncbi:hypothetical protein NL455_29340, partial [Klebsiella pneumoniae]|nr:hypothetical protein [Klebsiella pneumoniae]
GLLESIAALLTPEQRAAFHLSELREEHGHLVLGWNFKEPGVEATPELLEAIEACIDRVEREVQQLSCARIPRPAFPYSVH